MPFPFLKCEIKLNLILLVIWGLFLFTYNNLIIFFNRYNIFNISLYLGLDISNIKLDIC